MHLASNLSRISVELIGVVITSEGRSAMSSKLLVQKSALPSLQRRSISPNYKVEAKMSSSPLRPKNNLHHSFSSPSCQLLPSNLELSLRRMHHMIPQHADMSPKHYKSYTKQQDHKTTRRPPFFQRSSPNLVPDILEWVIFHRLLLRRLPSLTKLESGIHNRRRQGRTSPDILR